MGWVPSVSRQCQPVGVSPIWLAVACPGCGLSRGGPQGGLEFVPGDLVLPHLSGPSARFLSRGRGTLALSAFIKKDIRTIQDRRELHRL